MIWIILLLSVFQIYLAVLVGYLLLLAAGSLKVARITAPINERPGCRFLILVPAHNEEQLLPDLLESLSKVDYPKDQFAVHVVADNCTDQTAEAVRRSIAQVHIRKDCEHLGKGYALNWLWTKLHQAGEPHNAVVFLDADSLVSANFLRVMSAHLERGERAIQAYYTVRDPDLSWTGSLRYAALAVLHFLRPQGRMYLGTSAGLKGNGMVFTADLMEHYTWSSSMTEDIEFHMSLLLSGERVTFAPDAVVWGEMPDNLSNAVSQNLRWEQGKKQMAGKYLARLLAAAWQELRNCHFRKAFLLLDAVMEYIQPPFSILFGACLFSLATSFTLFVAEQIVCSWRLLGWPPLLAAMNMLLAVLLLLGQGVYLFSGLLAVSAPKQVYVNLLYAPWFIIWKTWLMILVLMGQRQNSWVRTVRNGSRNGNRPA